MCPVLAFAANSPDGHAPIGGRPLRPGERPSSTCYYLLGQDPTLPGTDAYQPNPSELDGLLPLGLERSAISVVSYTQELHGGQWYDLEVTVKAGLSLFRYRLVLDHIGPSAVGRDQISR